MMDTEPAFHKITLQDRALFEQYVSPSPLRNCDLSFANIYCWQDTYHSEVAEYGGFMLIRFRLEADEPAYMQPIGEGDIRHIIEALKEDAARCGTTLHICGATTQWCEALERAYPEQFAFRQERASADYIYSADDLATLPGRRYQPKRNHINRFKSRYTWHYEPLSIANIADCIRLNLRWMENKNCCTMPSQYAEQYALQRALLEFDHLPLRGGVLYADGEPAAFTYGSQINSDTFCIHIEKADPNIEGSATMINRLFAEEIATEYQYINREEDLGIEGLRYAKMKYHPVELLSKCSARLLGRREQEIRTLWQELFGDSREQIDSFLGRYYRPDLTLTHEVAERIVSMLHIVPMQDSEGRRAAYIYAVATSAEHRGQGIASALLRQATQKIEADGYDYAFLIPSSDDALRLYRRLGFCEPLLPVHFGSEHDFGTGDPASDLAMVYPIATKEYPTAEISTVG
ncbi:MAG: GNAT family N-acetyltransferase [Alistipes sp.]|nr:GNAT family N-acetyltransferase [Alistipes sp.]